jgi:hypothetical protein
MIVGADEDLTFEIAGDAITRSPSALRLTICRWPGR